MSHLLEKLTRTFGWGSAPTKVLHVQWNDYIHKHFSYVEGMFVVVPLPEVIGDDELKLAYEVVMHSEINNATYAFSLLRVATKEDGIQVVGEYSKLLPCFVESSGREFFNQSTLQKVLDGLQEKTTWLPAHIVAFYGFTEALKHNLVLRSLNEPEESKGLYPLHVAVENESEKLINHLLMAGASLEVFDKSGNSPLHFAASKNIAIIQALKPRRHRCLNLKNSAAETPLFLAAKAGKLDNIKALLFLGANVNHEEEAPHNFDTDFYQEKLKVVDLTKDISHKDLNKGGTLLHWVKTREMTNVAFDLGCSPNVLNSHGQTALHVMVLRGRIPCLMSLLSRGADPNYINFDGNSPLHLAASIQHIVMVQALICFGANFNAPNIAGETPRHIAASTKVEDKGKLNDKDRVIYLLHAVGAERCKKTMASCSEGCLLGGSFNGVPLYEKHLLRSRWVFDDHLARTQISEAIRYQKLFHGNLKGRGRVLCLDGGGIKGLVLCQMLDVISKLLGQPISESFDWISGTSTGGFLALNIATGKSVCHAQALYYSLKDRVFVGNRPYDTKNLETILKDEFGENTVMSSIKKNKVCVTTTLADRLPADLHMFRNYEAPIDVLGIGESLDYGKPLPPNKQRIWMAARASGAAPTYFSSTDKYLDGGLISNNPVLDALTEIEEWNMALRAAGREDEVFTPTVVVSLGCGKPPVVKVDNVDLTVPSLMDMRRSFQAVFNMFNLLVEQACASEGRVVDRARAWCAALHVPYFRFNPQLSEDCNIDEHEDAKLVRIMWEARAYMKSQSNNLLKLKDFLLAREVSRLDPPLPPPRRSMSAASTPVLRGRRSHSTTDFFPLNLRLPTEDFGISSSTGKLNWTESDTNPLHTSLDMETTPQEIAENFGTLSSPEDIFYSTDSELSRSTDSSKSVVKSIRDDGASIEFRCKGAKDPNDSHSLSSVNESSKYDDNPDSGLTESLTNVNISPSTLVESDCELACVSRETVDLIDDETNLSKELNFQVNAKNV